VGVPVNAGNRSYIVRNTNGPALVIDDDANVRLERIGVNDSANNMAANGIQCSSARLVADGIEVRGNDGNGISSVACELVLRNSSISENTTGGVSVSGGRVVIVNNVIVDNGSNTMSSYGGLRIDVGTDVASVVQSNTVMGNNATISDGVTCAIPGITVLNTIIFGDATKVRVAGTCTFDHTLYGPDDPGAMLGTARGNMLVPAMGDFNFEAPGDYHIKSDSVAKGKGTTTGLAAEAMTDVDGQPRPQGAPDVGADEIPD
jgi:hypothetical protein